MQVDCSNGKIGFGRRKREISGIPPDPNKVFEVAMTTFIKVDYKNEMAREKGKIQSIVMCIYNRVTHLGRFFHVINYTLDNVNKVIYIVKKQLCQLFYFVL